MISAKVQIRVFIEKNCLPFGACWLPENHDQSQKRFYKREKGKILWRPIEADEGDLRDQTLVSEVI